MPSSQSFSVSAQYDLIIFFSVWWNLSRAPWLSGWLDDDLNKSETPIFLSVVCSLFPKTIFLTFIILSNAQLMHDLLKNSQHEIWALIWLNRLWEAYKCEKNFRALTMFLVLIFLNGIASGKRVEAHIIVRRYSWPDLVLGKGPTQSIITLLKGSPKAGKDCKWAFGIVWLGFPTIWQVWQYLQNWERQI